MSIDAAVRCVSELGGVARTRALLRARVSRRDLSAAVRSGALVRPRHGVYADPATPGSVIEALSHRGVVACLSAARSWGLWVLEDDDPRTHTWVAGHHHPVRLALELDPEDGGCCILHRDAPLDAPSLTRVGLLHSLVQILACVGEEAFFAALESALRQRRVTKAALVRLRARIPERSRWLVDFARADADSGLESILRLRLHRLGLTLSCQVSIPGVGRVDFVIGDCLILEADGRTHDGPTRHADRMRDAAAAALGFSTLRFDYALLMHEWPLVEAAILATLRRGVHRSVAGLTW